MAGNAVRKPSGHIAPLQQVRHQQSAAFRWIVDGTVLSQDTIGAPAGVFTDDPAVPTPPFLSRCLDCLVITTGS